MAFWISLLESDADIVAATTVEGETIPHCSGDGAASILKSGLEIKNRCSRGVVAVCRRNHYSLQRRRLESDADIVAATTVAGGTILLCGNED